MSDNQKSPNDNKNPINKKPVPPNAKPPRNMFTMAIIVLVALMIAMQFASSEEGMKISSSEFWQRLENRAIEELTYKDRSISGTMKDDHMEGIDPETKSFQADMDVSQEYFFDRCSKVGFKNFTTPTPSPWPTLIISFLPWLVLIGFFYFFIYRQIKGGGGGGMLGNFGRSKHRMLSKDEINTTFKDVAGIQEAKEEVEEIIKFLRNPKKFQKLGGRVPRGILLVGQPGCGKTLLAKAIAGEADVPFFSISGSDFVEMFVGVGASRVRDLFKQAKENSPCIIFLDEIDAVGRKRGTGVSGGGNDEREQTLNAILVEMDGFSSNDQVIVLAATNRADVLDKALKRTGRFDRQVYVPLPDVKGRLEILKVHAKKIKLAENIDMHTIARGTSTFSGADIEALVNEAALAATMAEKDFVELSDLEEARDKVRWGRARKSRDKDKKELEMVAYHEAGHALVQVLCKHEDPLHKVTIIPRGSYGGATFSLPVKDRSYTSKKFCLDFIRVCFGGRIAEEIFCGDINSGASGDIQQATSIARNMVLHWGMSDKLGFVDYGQSEEERYYGTKPYSEQTGELIDQEIKDIMDIAYRDARNYIDTHRTEMENLKEALLKYETLDATEVVQIIDGKTLDKPSISDLLDLEDTPPPTTDAPQEDSDTPPDTLLGGPIPNPT